MGRERRGSVCVYVCVCPEKLGPSKASPQHQVCKMQCVQWQVNVSSSPLHPKENATVGQQVFEIYIHIHSRHAQVPHLLHMSLPPRQVWQKGERWQKVHTKCVQAVVGGVVVVWQEAGRRKTGRCVWWCEYGGEEGREGRWQAGREERKGRKARQALWQVGP